MWAAPVTFLADPTTSTPIITTGVSGTVGREYLACLVRDAATEAFTGVSDNGISSANVWARLDWAPKSGTAGRRTELYRCVPTEAFTQVVAAFEASSTARMVVVEVRGASGVINAVLADFRASSASPSPVQVTPTVANCMVIAFCQANPNLAAAITPDSGWTDPGSPSGGPKVVYRTDAPEDVAVGVSWTFSASAGSGHAIIALEESPEETPEILLFLWDGSNEIPLVLDVLWNGSEVTPISLEGIKA